jgi:hypothetical protein
LGVQVDGPLVVAQAVMTVSQAGQCAGLTVTVAGVSVDGERLGVQVDGPLVVAQAGVTVFPGRSDWMIRRCGCRCLGRW